MHGNKQALSATLAGAERHCADTLWSLGDLVGYGADPAVCAETCLDLATRSVAGNHDLGLVGRAPLDHFSAAAVAGLEHAREHVAEPLLERLSGMDPDAPGRGATLVHGSPRDPVWEYIVTARQAEAALEESEAGLILHGHTHVPAAWRLDEEGGVVGGYWKGDRPLDLEDGPWLVNPGAVGQPRDRDPRASWALLDLAAGNLRLFREEYDIAAAKAAIIDAELPPQLASRLDGGW